MQSPQIQFENNKIIYQYDPDLDPIEIESNASMFTELSASGQLLDYVNGFIPTDIPALKLAKIKEVSNMNPGCAKVYVMDADLSTHPTLVNILLPLVKSNRVKLMYNPTVMYDKFIFVNPGLFKFFSENARYRIDDLGGDLTVSNRAVLSEFIYHVCEKNSTIKQLDFIIPTSSSEADAFIAKHGQVIMKPLYDYCKVTYRTGVIMSAAEIDMPYDNNLAWTDYLYSDETDSTCPFMLQEVVEGQSITATGYIGHGLHTTAARVVFASCPDEVAAQVTEVITNIGISFTFFTLSGLVKDGVFYPTSIDLSIPPVYLGDGALSIEECTTAFADVFNVATLG